MKITAINGSPKGKQSATYIMIEEFLKGAESKGAQTSHSLLSDMKIHHCLGCLSCWTKTPGVCVFKDDMQKIDFADSDLIVYATPLFVDNVSGLLKNFMDRTVFSAVPSMENDANGEAVHPKKQKIRPKMMVMANCGFPGQSHFEVLKILFRRMARNYRTDLIAEIYRDEGPLLIMNEPQLEPVIARYKLLLQQAGREIVQNLKISETTGQALKEALIPHDLYLQNHNEYFKQFKTV
jgi:multimeric flavodoxin WrbA